MDFVLRGEGLHDSFHTEYVNLERRVMSKVKNGKEDLGEERTWRGKNK